MHLPRLVLSVMLAIAACTLCPSTASAQDIIRLTGKVLLKTDNEPLVGVNITDAATKRAMATTDLDGRFAFNVRTGTTLKFSMVGIKPQTLKIGRAHV